MRIRTVCLVPLLLLLGCATTKADVLSRSLAGVDAAEKAFVAWDKQHQEGIVAASSTRASGEAELEAYRAQRNKVSVALVAAYASIAAASADGSEASLHSTITTMAAVVTALRQLGVIPGGGQ